MKNITARRALSLLEYDRSTGILRWKETRNNYTKKGSIAGSIGPQGYISVKIDGNTYLAHRLIWLIVYGRWPKNYIDHIDHCEANNALENLREVTLRENVKNRRLRAINTSGVSGVNRYRGKWVARIVNIEGKRIALGSFDDIAEAAAARDAAKILYGYHPNHGL